MIEVQNNMCVNCSMYCDISMSMIEVQNNMCVNCSMYCDISMSMIFVWNNNKILNFFQLTEIC